MQKSVTVIPQTDSPLLDAFTFDLTENVQITYPGSAFRHPLQNGNEGITDAVHLDSPELQVSGVLSDTPITPIAGIPGPLQIALGLGGFGASVQPGTPGRKTSLLELLLRIREAKVPVTVLCSWLPPLRNRWPETVDAARGKEQGNSLTVSVRFPRMRIVTTGVIPALQDSDIVALSQQTVDIGAVPAFAG